MKTIPLTQGQVALVDDEDFERLIRWKWRAELASNNKYYAVRYIRRAEGGVYWRLTMANAVLRVRNGILVDHKNRSPLDNRRQNLRCATRGQNNANSERRDTSQFRGVQQHHEKFRAQISVNGKIARLGVFKTAVEAACAYDNAAREMQGEFAVLNFPRVHRTVERVETRFRWHRQCGGGAHSGYRGVYLNTGGRWLAQIEWKGRIVRRYGFKSAIDAARAYNELARQLHGKFAVLNRDADGNVL